MSWEDELDDIEKNEKKEEKKGKKEKIALQFDDESQEIKLKKPGKQLIITGSRGEVPCGSPTRNNKAKR